MKKFFILVSLWVLTATMLQAQYTEHHSRQPLEKQQVQIAAPLKDNIFTLKEPLGRAPAITFDSMNVTFQGSWGLGQSYAIFSDSAGNTLFIGSGAGVVILDVTNPSAPVKISQLSTRGLVDQMFYDETTERLYVTAYFAGFEIWDLSNMATPVKLGGGETTGLPRGGIYAAGNHVYVVSVADGIQIFDVTNPTAPVNVGNCPLGTSALAWTSAMSGNLIFVALSEGGMAVVDVTDPVNPVVAGNYGVLTTGVWIENGYAYTVAYDYGIRVLDISNLSSITEVGAVALDGFPYRVQVQGDYAYVANSTTNPGGGINVIDVSDPANPQFVTTYAGYADNLTVNNDLLGFSGSNFPVSIMSISAPGAPALESTYKLPLFMNDITVSGNYAYTGNNGFRVFDVSDKSNPQEVGYDSTYGAIVRLAGDKAVFIRESMSSNNPVMIMDISDPTQPSFIGQYMSPVMTVDLEVRGHYAYVGCWWDGFRVIDFQDPANPVLVAHGMGWFNGAVPGQDFCYVQALDVEGNYLYLIDYEPFSNEPTRGLYILDVTDPTNPVFVNRYTGLASSGNDIDAAGNFVYVSDMNGGVEVIDVTNKQDPIARGYVSLPDAANPLSVTGNHAVVANYINGGVQIVNISNPDDPFVEGYYLPTGCFALGVTTDGDDIYVADGIAGFQIYQSGLITGVPQHGITGQGKSRAYPNPFTDCVTITGDEDVNAELSIYDGSGRLVATLSGTRDAGGSVTFRWDGTTVTGTVADAGFYFYTNASGTISGKTVRR